MQSFDAFGDLIKSVNILRLRTHFLPQKNYHKVISAHDLKNAMWDLNESVMQIGALLNGYLIKSKNGSLSNLNRDALLLRVYQQTQSADHAVYEVSEFSESVEVKGDLETQLLSFIEKFSGQYHSLKDRLVNDLTTGNHSDISPDEWILVADDVRQTIQKLSTESVNRTLDTAHAIENKAIMTLGLDTLLVLLCVGMAISSTGIARKVQYQATHDDLTQLPNRRFFIHNIQEQISKSGQSRGKLALLTIDLNRFKSVNDSLGHAVGDNLLQQVASRLVACTDDRMCVARMGGDEFAMLFLSLIHI